jgi:hypothetical protein
MSVSEETKVEPGKKGRSGSSAASSTIPQNMTRTAASIPGPLPEIAGE